jgi:hypothetical protein
MDQLVELTRSPDDAPGGIRPIKAETDRRLTPQEQKEGWERIAGYPLTDEDMREITHNLKAYFDLLCELHGKYLSPPRVETEPKKPAPHDLSILNPNTKR